MALFRFTLTSGMRQSDSGLCTILFVIAVLFLLYYCIAYSFVNVIKNLISVWLLRYLFVFVF